MQSLPLQIEGTGIRLEPDASETIAVPGSLCRKECSPVKCSREAYRHHLASDVFSNKTDPGVPGRLDLVEVCLDGVATGLRLGSGHRHLLGLGPVDGHSRLGEEAAVQRIDQAVESRIGQRDLLLIVEPSQGHGLMGVPRIRRHLGPEPLQRTEPLASPLEASSTMTRCRKISSTRA